MYTNKSICRQNTIIKKLSNPKQEKRGKKEQTDGTNKKQLAKFLIQINNDIKRK